MGTYPSRLSETTNANQEITHIESPVKIRDVIDFRCSIPFTEIPRLVEEGFEAQKGLPNCDPKVAAHYQVAHDTLKSCLGDPLCDVLLMIVLTFASSTVTPALRVDSDHFEEGPRRDPRFLAATLATRMLWFLRPRDFPWYDDTGTIFGISKMMEKMGTYPALNVTSTDDDIEHKGVNNRILKKLKWVRQEGRRRTPRNCELSLQRDELLEYRWKLLSLLPTPDAFIAEIFGTNGKCWIGNCSAILNTIEIEHSEMIAS
jgi:hypothetical protein